MEGRNLSSMTKRVAEVTNAFLRLTDDMNIKRNDVMTSGVNINPRYRYENKTGRRIFDGRQKFSFLFYSHNDIWD